MSRQQSSTALHKARCAMQVPMFEGSPHKKVNKFARSSFLAMIAEVTVMVAGSVGNLVDRRPDCWEVVDSNGHEENSHGATSTNRGLDGHSSCVEFQWNPDLLLPAKRFQVKSATAFSGGAFRVKARLGCGADSIVELVESTANPGNFVAVKFSKKNRKHKLDREAQLLAKYAEGCPNVIELLCHGVNQKEKESVLVLPLCKGGDLISYLADSFPTKRHKTAATVMAQLTAALADLHNRGLVHNDVKPNNILFEEKKDCTSLRLSDFGSAVEVDPQTRKIERCEASDGTVAFWPPERLTQKVTQGHETISEKHDVWASGIILYEMLVAEYPFGHIVSGIQTWSDLLKAKRQLGQAITNFWKSHVWPGGISKKAIRLVTRLLAEKPEDRPTAAGCLKDPFILKYADIDVLPDGVKEEARELRRSLWLRLFPHFLCI